MAAGKSLEKFWSAVSRPNSLSERLSKRRISLTLSVALFLAFSHSTASAELIAYTSLASFEAASTGLTDVNFNGIAASGSFVSYDTPPGLTLSGVNFNISNPASGDGLNVTSQTYYGPNTYANDFLVNAYDPSATTLTEVITLATPSTAVGLDLGTLYGGALSFSFSTGDTYSLPSPVTSYSTQFLGFTSNTAISTISITLGIANADGLVIDDFKYGTAVPEPSSLALVVVGVAGTLASELHRRRRKNSEI